MTNPAISENELNAVSAARKAAETLGHASPPDAVIYAMLMAAHRKLHGAIVNYRADEIHAMMEHWNS